MKRKLFFIAVIVICLSLTAYGTLAYFTADGTAHNVITTGDVDIVLIDSIKDGKQEQDGWSLSGVMPGQQVEKHVAVDNTGSGAAWIRVKLTVTITDANGEPLDTQIQGKDKVVNVVSYSLDTDSWQEKGGYIYYLQPVPAGKATVSLFEKDIVEFAKEMGNEYQGCHVSILVEAEAVQSANNGDSALTATGWPKSGT